MQIHLNTDSHVQGHEGMERWAEGELRDKLARFADRITRIDVHLSDASPTRVGVTDKRCTLEARLAGRKPMAASHDAAKVADALSGAIERLLRVLDADAGRQRDAHGRDTIRGSGGNG